MTSLPQAPFQNIIFLYVLAASPLQTPAQVRQAPELLGWKMVMVEQVCPPFLSHTILPYHNNTGFFPFKAVNLLNVVKRSEAV
jgi:hypothetical protein